MGQQARQALSTEGEKTAASSATREGSAGKRNPPKGCLRKELGGKANQAEGADAGGENVAGGERGGDKQ